MQLHFHAVRWKKTIIKEDSLQLYVDKCIFNFYLTWYSLIKIIFSFYGASHNIKLEFIMGSRNKQLSRRTEYVEFSFLTSKFIIYESQVILKVADCVQIQ